MLCPVVDYKRFRSFVFAFDSFEFVLVRWVSEMSAAALAKADKLVDEKKWSDAVAAYKKCIGPRPKITDQDRSYVYNRLGYVHGPNGLNEHEALIDWYTKRIDIDPNNSVAAFSYHGRGAAHRLLGKYSLALADFNRAIALYPATQMDLLALCYRGRSRVYQDLKQYDMELADSQKCVSLSTNAELIEMRKKRIAELRDLLAPPAAPAVVDQKATADAVTAALDAETNKRKREADSGSIASVVSDGASNKRAKPTDSASEPKGSSVGEYQSAPAIQLSALTVTGLSEYLRSIDPAYIKSFAHNKINGAGLCMLDDSELTE